MMAGTVRDRHVLLPITFRLSSSPDLALEFVVDTGFTGLLTLPPAAVAAMGLPFLHRIPAQLADGSFVEIDVHSATILWKGVEAEARVLATGEHPLLGTALLDGSELLAQFMENGLVTIDDI
jgi:clan AA aspartic protease